MKWIEAKVLYESEDREYVKNKIADIFYEFGVRLCLIEWIYTSRLFIDEL